MSLATYGKHPWNCWVFFVIDDDFNIYFISGDSQHTRDIIENNEVACAISDTMQNPLGSKKGVQIYGIAEQVKGPEQLKWFFNMWKKVLVAEEKKLTYKNYLDKVFDSKVYKITPKKIKWFNDELEGNMFELDM
jgi:hypothetical protein